MQLLLAATLASVSLAVSATDSEATSEVGKTLQWSQHYAQAKQMAAKEQRPLLVIVEDPSKPEGQFPEERLAANAEQVDLLKRYRLCKMDVNTSYGKRVAEAFGADRFPLTVITDKSANWVMFRADGEMTPEAWNRALTRRLADSTRVVAGKVVVNEPASSSAAQSSAAESALSDQSIDASQVIHPWSGVPRRTTRNCPNCVRNRQFYYYQ